jgi:exosortase/archaeosortase family protein
MILVRRHIDKLAPYAFIIKFLFLFAFLYLLFPFFRGIVAPGGTFYSSFAQHYVNPVKGLTSFITSGARVVLEMLNYETLQRNYSTLRIASSRGIVVSASCLGWGVMSFWAAFVVANKGDWQHKLKWLVIGISSILLLNILRISMVALGNHFSWDTIINDHHLIFTILSYSLVILMILWFITVQNKHEARTA